MVRKFKHKATGDIATQHSDCKDLYEIVSHNDQNCSVAVPASLIEKSVYDWEEITEKPILVTEDGYEAFELDNIWKVDLNGLNIVEDCPCKSNLTTLPERFKFFAYQENAEAYIERNKPKYSDEDLDHIRRVVDEDIDYYVNEHELKGSIMTAIENLRELKNSKND